MYEAKRKVVYIFKQVRSLESGICNSIVQNELGLGTIFYKSQKVTDVLLMGKLVEQT